MSINPRTTIIIPRVVINDGTPIFVVIIPLIKPIVQPTATAARRPTVAGIQESGRGGRDRRQADVVLLLGPDEAGAACKEGDTLEQRRYAEFIRSVSDHSRCRREALLGLLSTRPEACFGCDVCEGTLQAAPAGAAEIRGLVKRYPRFFTLRGAVTVLSGHYKPEIYERNLWRFKGFASLCDWTEVCIEEAVLTLVRAGRLRRHKRGPWKEMLQLRNGKAVRK